MEVTVRIKTWKELLEDCNCVDGVGDLEFDTEFFVKEMMEYCGEIVDVTMDTKGTFVLDGWTFTGDMYEVIDLEEFVDSYNMEMYKLVGFLTSMNEDILGSIMPLLLLDDEESIEEILEEQQPVGEIQKAMVDNIRQLIQDVLDIIENHPAMTDTHKKMLMNHVDFVTTHAMLVAYLQ